MTPNLNQYHEYDQLDRLSDSQRGEPALSRIDYSYDLSGNRTGKLRDNTTLQSYNTDPDSNRLQSQSGAKTVSYSYDPAGNLSSDGTFSYSYNAAGRRIAATAAGQSINYGYDAIGQRVTKTAAGIITQFFYDEQGHLTGKYGASGQLEQEIIWLGDLPVAVLKPSTSATTPDIYYIHADHLGTPRRITRPGDNRVVWSWESEAFGNSLPDQNPSGLGDFVFNLRFPGQYYDKETGLFYNYFRDYDPKTGRYIESDPIGLRSGINTYTYVNNNPLNLIDPFGLDGIAAAQWARSQVGNIGYGYFDLSSESHGKLQDLLGFLRVRGLRSPKCNKFVWDALANGGDPAGRMADGRIPSASEWANPKVNIPGYYILSSGSTLNSGDVISDGKHMGVYVPLDSGSPGTVSAAFPLTGGTGYNGGVVNNDWGFRSGQSPVARRCECDK